ncbi:dynein light chain Tctex-type 5-like [Gigantopelta aegis]|uniref:dynein light chain Tctex-type 5-like n=1 Tax=Gigantopelta aegis TaxID=1735272 RepID=UPI001B8886C5|nr:dynein light chain Tctex-type 5-like [Gigantopelta aegis]
MIIMSTAVRRPSTGNVPNMRRPSLISTHKHPPSVDISTSGRAAMIMTSAQTHTTVPVSKMENSFSLEPSEKFPYSEVKEIMKIVMHDMIGNMSYDAEECTTLSANLADVIKQKVKEVCIPRYKIVTNVSIGQLSGSSLCLTSRCIWNEKFDNYSEYTYTNGKLYAVGLVHGMFCE